MLAFCEWKRVIVNNRRRRFRLDCISLTSRIHSFGWFHSIECIHSNECIWLRWFIQIKVDVFQMPYRAFDQLLACGQILNSQGEAINTKGGKLQELRKALDHWTTLKNPSYRIGSLDQWPSTLTHDRPLWSKTVHFDPWPSTLIQDRPLWSETVHFYPRPSTFELIQLKNFYFQNEKSN